MRQTDAGVIAFAVNNYTWMSTSQTHVDVLVPAPSSDWEAGLAMNVLLSGAISEEALRITLQRRSAGLFLVLTRGQTPVSVAQLPSTTTTQWMRIEAVVSRDAVYARAEDVAVSAPLRPMGYIGLVSVNTAATFANFTFTLGTRAANLPCNRSPHVQYHPVTSACPDATSISASYAQKERCQQCRDLLAENVLWVCTQPRAELAPVCSASPGPTVHGTQHDHARFASRAASSQ